MANKDNGVAAQRLIDKLHTACLPEWVAGKDIRAGWVTQLCPAWSQQPAAVTGIHALRALRNPPARVSLFMNALRTFIGQPAIWSTGADG
ncbi:hypothetical protein [Erwinia persicina]